MKELRKRIFAAVLAALMIITAMPVTVLYASAETEDTVKTGDGDMEETGTEDAGETGDGDTEEPEQEPPADTREEDTAKCICETPCREDSINGDCPVCGADNAGLLDCRGKDVEENAGQPEDTGVCRHHQEHDDACGCQPASEDGESSPCTYECRICPVEDLIAALPDTVTEDNADDVRARLDEILDLYRELNEDEQGQFDLSRCYELQEALDNANVPMTAAETIGGKVKTYNGSEETTSFTASDTIKVVAAPTPAGTASADSTMFAAGFTAPGAGQMAVFVKDTQVSEPVDAVDGAYTMTVSASDVLTLGGVEPNGDPIPLTAKFVGNDNMADTAGTVDVIISAVAKVEKDDKTTYVSKEGLDAALTRTSGNAGAVFTLLKDVINAEKEKYLNIQIDCTLDLNGHTIRSTGQYACAIGTYGGTTVTIRGEGTVISEQGHGLSMGGTVTLEGGTFTSGGDQYCGVYVNSESAELSVIGETVVIQNTGGGYGLGVNAVKSVSLSAGTYLSSTGDTICVWNYGSSPPTLGDLLGHKDDTRYAYYQNDALVTGGLDGKRLTGTVTVKPCTHACEYIHEAGTTTHIQTCPACGDVKTSENCSYVDGKCVCSSTLSVALTGTENLVYNGSPHTPSVTVTLDGTELTATGYDVTYAGNVDAGTDTAAVTVTGKGSYRFEGKKTFSIEKAEQENFAVVAGTGTYEKNGTFALSTTGGSGGGTVLYRVPENNGVLMVNGDTAAIIGAGTVTVTATKAESDNYKAAVATGNITIEKASAPAVTYPSAGSITYGQKLSDCPLTGGSTEYGTFAWEDGGTVPAAGDTADYAVVFTASEETKKNYEIIINTTQNVSVKVEKAVPAVSITAELSGSKDNRQAVLTVNVAKAGAGAFPTGTVTLIDCTGSAEKEIGTITLNSSGTASYTWGGLLDQMYTIKAVYAGNDNYKETESRELTFDAAKQNQQDFALDAIGAKTYGDAAVTLKTTGGSGNGAVRYESSDENVIRIENGRAVITGAGTAVITAIKAGDDNYNEASASRNVTVAKKELTVSADSKAVVRGNPMPALTYRADGLVNGDTFTAAPSITAGAQNTDTIGKYDIVISGGTLQNSENYRITYVNGTLNIVERLYTVTVTDGTGGGEYAVIR